jgi:cytosine/adenosine deaminase-related metal-dependent hydrolase
MNRPLEHLPLDRTVVGTDFSSPDVLAELAAGWLQLRDRGTRLPIDRLLLALANSQRLASQCLGLSLGSFQSGAAADLVVYDYDPPAPLTAASLAEHLIYGLPTAGVDAVLIHGRFRVRGGQYVAGDSSRLMARAREDAVLHRARLNGSSLPTRAHAGAPAPAPAPAPPPAPAPAPTASASPTSPS